MCGYNFCLRSACASHLLSCIDCNCSYCTDCADGILAPALYDGRLPESFDINANLRCAECIEKRRAAAARSAARLASEL